MSGLARFCSVSIILLLSFSPLVAIDTPATEGRDLPSYTLFESGQVRPLALSADGRTLFSVNTPDSRLEIIDVVDDELVRRDSVLVGLEPVAVAVHGESEVWVVNHLSDSISIVDHSADPPRVVRTLWVGDEPRDIVFGGSERHRAFITTAHRGQNSPVDPAPNTPGIGRADIWVFDADSLGDAPGGEPITIVTLFGDTPRALAVTPDGSRVFAAVFLSGNVTTTVGVSDAAGTFGGEDPSKTLPKPPPHADIDGIRAPETGIIVKFDGERWIDEVGTDYSEWVPFALPDFDVFEIDALADPPRELRAISGVGTTLFNLAVNPQSGTVYVSNLEAQNEVRFVGPGIVSTTLKGHIVEDRITVIRGDTVTPRFVNTHIDFDIRNGETIPRDEKAKSLSQILEMAITRDGETMYAATFGSSKIAVFDTSALEDGSFVPDAGSQIVLPGGGPTGVVLGPEDRRLFVLTRFDNSVHMIDTESFAVLDSLALPSPEPAAIVTGRPIHYDANFASGNGTATCASCHPFGDVDALAWDLGFPEGSTAPNPNPIIDISIPAEPLVFHSMKGPMTTQTFRGMSDSGPMHWRGDRTGQSPQVQEGESIERAAFKEFRDAFVDILGRIAEPTEGEMNRFASFTLAIVQPPNPIRALDRSLTPLQERGRHIFSAEPLAGFCFSCHVREPSEGHFGTSGHTAMEAFMISQEFKIPSLRNLYQKVGAFGGGTNEWQGDQIRGFGLLNDGSRGSFANFLQTGTAASQRNEPEVVAALGEFVFVAETNLAPIVGQQVTLGPNTSPAARERAQLMIARAALGGDDAECDLVAKGIVDSSPRGFLFTGGGAFRADRDGETVTTEDLFALTTGGVVLTLTCVPPGSGVRVALDRDQDGALDADEIDAGTDPADPASVPRSADAFRRGDCNSDRGLDLSDPVYLLGVLFTQPDFSPPRCPDACDFNDDGDLNISDAIFGLGHLFTQGAQPPEPFERCGDDPTDDSLSCATDSPCQ